MAFCFSSTVSYGQGWDDNSGWDDSGDGWGDNSGDDGWGNDNSNDGWGNDNGNDGNYDYDQGSGSANNGFVDSTGDDGWGSDDGWGDDSDWGGGDFGGQDYVRSARPKVEARPYERFTGMPYDSSSMLITYQEVVEVIPPDRFLDLGGEDYSLADSLYARAMKWMQNEFGKRETKQMIDASGIDEKGREGNTINAYITMPLKVEVNKYKTMESGLIEFDMELRFKDERYRYKFENFVHVERSSPKGQKPDATYMEYYLTSKRDIRGNDKILIACDNQINRLIDDLKATCAHTPFVDDDDW